MSGSLHKMLAACLLASTLVITAGCTKDWNDPEYMAEQLLAGNPEAFRRVQRFPTEEEKIVHIPGLIAAYNGGIQEDSLRVLTEIGHRDGLPVFVDALSQTDPAIAGQGAYGISTVGANEHAVAIAERLSRITEPQQYTPFLEALVQLEGDPGVSPLLIPILSQPAQTIGITTVRLGCIILGRSGATDDATIRSLLFGLVNFVPNPYQESFQECEQGLMRVGNAASSQLVEMFLGQNTQINEHLTAMHLSTDVAGLRAARVLGDMRAQGARDAIVQWFASPHTVDVDLLNSMSYEERQGYYQNYGQTFELACKYLAQVATVAPEDPAHTMLRQLIARGEGSPLENFADFMTLTDLAEYSMRASAVDALADVGDIADRDVIYEMAMAGDLQTGPDAMIRLAAAHSFALLAQAGDMTRFQELANAVEDPEMREEYALLETMMQIAEACPQHNVDCLAPYLDHESVWARQKSAFDLAHFPDNPTAAAAALISNLDHSDMGTKLDYVRYLRRLPLPQTGREDLIAARGAAGGQMNRDFRHELALLMLLNGIDPRSAAATEGEGETEGATEGEPVAP